MDIVARCFCLRVCSFCILYEDWFLLRFFTFLDPLLIIDFCNNKNNIISGDLCILKDVIQHWSLHDIYAFLDYMVEHKRFKYIMICNCSYQTEDNTDISNGDFRPLSYEYFPLKKYHPTKIYEYSTKEVSIIKLYDD